MIRFTTSQTSGVEALAVSISPNDKIRILLESKAFAAASGYILLLPDDDAATLLAALHIHILALRGREKTNALLRQAYSFVQHHNEPRSP